MKEEDGLNSGWRKIGWLALSLVVLALGAGVASWLGVFQQAHEIKHKLSQEERAAVYVGAQKRPTSKLRIEQVKRDCPTVTRADIDGAKLLLYARNDCHQDLDYLEFHWQLLSPNQTIIKEGYTNQCAVASAPGDVSECLIGNVSTDDRAVSVRVWAQRNEGAISSENLQKQLDQQHKDNEKLLKSFK